MGPKDRTLPGGLELVRDFLNTRDVEAGTDELGTPGGVSDWCLRRGLLEAGEELGDPDRGRIVEVREGLREVLAERGANAGARGAGPLDRVARRSPLVVRFGRDGEPWLEPAAAGIERTIARILAVVFAAQASGHWARLKVCQDDGCRWAFYDNSKNRSRTWCSMAVCGNRAKTRSFRRRQSGAGS